ncbi:unnamed protein product [Periconia digitata]|uniref:Circumsporozoite protein n=1 Tax=Periconia digitata TaxID=1303443 RepID=A0A9W4XPB4_9PLEO|nr:unnamed protein product [Periconia digitata]
MVSKVFILTAIIAYVEARFGQEQVPIADISAVQGGDAGAAATIAGAAISDLLGGANSCDKLVTADQIFTELGGGADALAAAIGMVTAEKNTNPFAGGNVQNVCGDATLPVTPELRGITPLIDPDVDTAGGVAALSASSAAAPLDATGKSVFDLLDEAGFGDLVASQAAGGGAATAAAAGGAAQNNNQGANGNAQQGNGNAQQGNGNAQQGNAQQGNAQQGNAQQGNAQQGNAQQGNAQQGNGNAQQGNGNAQQGNGNAQQGNGNAQQGNGNAQQGNGNAQQGNGNAQQGNAGGNNAAAGGNNAAAGGNNAAAGGAADFGDCTPTIFFEGGLNGRPADEFTFQIEDPLARGGQGEALNPNIITNALCNQLTNVCNANDAAITQCEDAKAQVEAAGTRDQTTADLFNSAIQGGAAARKMRRGLRIN